MRILPIYILLVIWSCKTTVSKQKLLGSWTIVQDEAKHSKGGIADRLIFLANDSFKVETYVNGKLNESITGKYSLDEKQKVITTMVDKLQFKSEIIELTDTKLSTKNEKMKMITNYRRQ